MNNGIPVTSYFFLFFEAIVKRKGPGEHFLCHFSCEFLIQNIVWRPSRAATPADGELYSVNTPVADQSCSVSTL